MYIFEHLGKTGGSTFHSSYLRAAFGSDEFHLIPGEVHHNGLDIQRLTRLPDGELRQLKIIAGHNASKLKVRFPQAKFLSLVRNPVDRLVSSYLHTLYHKDAHAIIGA